MGLVQQNLFCVPRRFLREPQAASVTSNEHPRDELERLQRRMNELAGILALPATSAGDDPLHIARTLLDALLTMLNLDFIYLRLVRTQHALPGEMVRLAPSFGPLEPGEIGAALDRVLGHDATRWSAVARISVGDADVSVEPARLGLRGDIGMLVAGSQRPGFPSQTDSVLLRVAANQAALAFVPQESAHSAADGEPKDAAERGRMASAPLESEADPHAIVGRIPGVVLFVMTPAGELESVSPQLTRYFGKTLEQLKHWSGDDTVHPEDRSRINGVFAQAIARGEPYRFEGRFRRADGVYQWFQCRGRPSRDEAGRIARWYCVGIDIDERKRAEDALRTEIAERRRAEVALRESERDLRSIIDGIPGFVASLAPDGEVEAVNRQIVEYCGQSLNELRNWGTNGTVHGDDLSHVSEVFVESIASGIPYEIEQRLRRADGAYRWFSNRGIPIRNDAGQIVRWYVLLTDIDDQKQAEALLAGEKKLLEMVASGRPVVAILEALCRLVESTAAGCCCSIVLVDASGGKLQEAIAPSLAAEFNESARGWPLDRIGGPCVAVARDKTQVIMSDVASDERWRASWRALAQKHGLRSCWSTPIVSLAGKVLGTFALYWREAGSPNQSQQELISQFTNIASIAIERAQRDATLRHSEARLAAAERDLQLTVDTIPVFVAAYEPDGTRSFVNRRWQEHMGLSLQEAIGPSAKTFPHFHPDDAERNDAAWRASLASGEPLSIDVRVRGADGQYRWHTSRRVPLRDEKGDIVRWYSVGIDIDDQKAAENARRRSEAELADAKRELQATIDTIPALIASYWPNGERDFVNLAWQRFTGSSQDQARGRTEMIAVHPDRKALGEAMWQRSLETGEPFELEEQLWRVDGEYRWHRVRRVPARDENGKIIKWYGVGHDIDDQKQVEGALRRSEARLAKAERELQLMIDTIPAFVTVFGPGGEREYVNKTWRDNTGLQVSDIQDGGWTRIVHPNDQERSDRLWREALATGEPLRIEQRIRRHDGQYRWHMGRRVPLRDESGNILRWYSVAIDIEDQKRAEEALRKSEAQLKEAQRELQLTIDSIPVLVAAYRPDGVRTFVNQTWRNYTGLTQEEVTGEAKTAFPHFHPDDAPQVEPAIRASLASGEPFPYQVRLRSANGEYRWHQVRRTPVRDENGAIIRWYSTGFDIQDQKVAEEARRQSEARLVETERELRLTVDSIPTITWRAGPNGYVQQLNRRWYEYTGTTADQVRGWRWKLCVHPDDLDRLVDAGTEYVSSGTPIDCEARLQRFDGEYRWFLFRPAPALNESGDIIAWYGSITDIQDRKQAEEAQRESEVRLTEAERELRRTLDSIPTMTWRAAANGYVEQINKQAFDYTGATPEQMAGNRWHHVVHPDDLPGLLATGNINVPAGKPLDYEARLRRFDGEYRWFLFRLAPSRDETGQVVAWYGSITDIEDRKQAEQALQQSEAQLARAERELRRTLDSIPTMTWRAAPNGYVQQINKQFFDYTGTATEQMQGRGWQSVVHPDDIEPLLEIGRSYVASGIPMDAEARLRRSDGTYRWFLFRPAPARDETGNIIAWYGSITDIEDRKRAEDKAVEAERETQRTIDHIPVLVGTYTADGHRIFANKRALEVTGLSVEDVPTDRWWKAFHPDDVESVKSQWRNCIATGQPFEREVRTRTADGTYRWHLTRRVPLHDAGGAVIRWYGVSYDIDDQRRAEEELRRSEALLTRGQQLSSTGTFSWRVDTDELTFSEELYRIFELDPHAGVTRERVLERAHLEDRPLLSGRMAQIRAGHAPPDQEIRLQMPDGRVKYVRSVGQTIRHQDGRQEYLGAVQDMTERRLAEDALDKVRSELARVTRVMSLGALTASIAHEVNQPLAGIVMNASTCLRMLAADPPNVEGARETARRTIRDGNRAADVITRLRALFSKKAAATEAVDLNEATREVLALVFSDLLRSRVVARVELDDEHPLLITGDRVQLQQVILNLVRNAIDAMNEVNDRPRNLLVKADRDEQGDARLIVKDAGVGFQPQGAERLFDAFYTTKDDGMGIGLSVSRSIIESHGGRLWAEANEGPGATVSFSIPPQTTDVGDESAIWMPPTRGAHDPTRNA